MGRRLRFIEDTSICEQGQKKGFPLFKNKETFFMCFKKWPGAALFGKNAFATSSFVSLCNTCMTDDVALHNLRTLRAIVFFPTLKQK